MKKFLFILLTIILSFSIFIMLTGCGESQQDKQLREYKESSIAELEEKINDIVEAYQQAWSGKSNPPEFLEYYYNTLFEKACGDINRAASMTEVGEAAYAVRKDIDDMKVAYYFTDHMILKEQNVSFAYEHNINGSELSVAMGNYASPISSEKYSIYLKAILPPGMTMKIYYGDGLEFKYGAAPSPISVEADDSDGGETRFNNLIKTDILWRGTDSDPIYDINKSYRLFLIFEKDGFVQGYTAIELFDAEAYEAGKSECYPIKEIMYDTDYRNSVNTEKALEYIEKACRGIDGEAEDGVKYIPLGKIYNPDGYTDGNRFFESETYQGDEKFCIFTETGENKIWLTVTDGAEAYLSTSGEFVSGDEVTQEISAVAGDEIVYRNVSGNTEFIRVTVVRGGKTLGFALIAVSTDNSSVCRPVAVYSIYYPGSESFEEEYYIHGGEKISQSLMDYFTEKYKSVSAE